jgi:histone-binding protein RBBP4
MLLGTNTSGSEPNYLMIGKVRMPLDETPVDLSTYNQNNNQAGGLGLAAGDAKIEVEIKILHEGEINKARYMPQKYNVVATQTSRG